MEDLESEEQVSVGQLLRPDNSNVKRGFALVGIALALGIFISLSVLEPTDDAGISTESEVAAPTVSIAEPNSDTTVEVTTTTVEAVTTTDAEETTTSESETTEAPATTAAPTTQATTTTTAGSSRSDTVVRVFNDAGFAGVAGLATSIIGDAGFDTVSPTDAPEPDQTLSQVLYGAGSQDFAQEIASLLNISSAQVQQLTAGNRPIDDVDDVDIVVVIGRNEDLPR